MNDEFEKEQKAFLDHIASCAWDDEAPRMVYSDWLLEHDMPEESERQRNYVAAERWLREFAKTVGPGEYYYVDVVSDDTPTFESLIETGHKVLKTGEPEAHSFHIDNLLWKEKELVTQFWDNWEIITGVKVGIKTTEPFTCPC